MRGQRTLHGKSLWQKGGEEGEGYEKERGKEREQEKEYERKGERKKEKQKEGREKQARVKYLYHEVSERRLEETA